MPRRRLSRYAFHRRLRLLRRSQRRSKGRRAFLLVAMLILALPLMVIPAFAAESVGNLPAVDGLSATGLNQDMLIFDRHGTLIDDIGDHGDHRIVVPLNSMSPFVKQATIAIEDKTFYKNNGVDFGGIVRAALADYLTRHRPFNGRSARRCSRSTSTAVTRRIRSSSCISTPSITERRVTERRRRPAVSSTPRRTTSRWGRPPCLPGCRRRRRKTAR